MDYTQLLKAKQMADNKVQSAQTMRDEAAYNAINGYKTSGRNPMAYYIDQNRNQQKQNEEEIKSLQRTSKEQALINGFTAIGNTIASFGGVRTQPVNQTPLYRNLNRIQELRRQGVQLGQSLADMQYRQEMTDRENQQRTLTQQYNLANEGYKQAIAERDKTEKELQRQEDLDYKREKDRQAEERFQKSLNQRATQFATSEANKDRRHQETLANQSQKNDDKIKRVIVPISIGGQNKQRNMKLTPGIKTMIDNFVVSNINSTDEQLGSAINLLYKNKDGQFDYAKVNDEGSKYSMMFPHWYNSLNEGERFLVNAKINQDNAKELGNYKPATKSQLDKLFKAKGLPDWEVLAKSIGLEYTE